MELTAVLFYLFSAITLGSAVVMVFSKNIVHSAFSLMFTLIGVASLYILLYADFVAATQLLVYVGGILILILFGIMLTTQGLSDSFETIAVHMVPTSLIAIVTATFLLVLFFTTDWALVETVERSETITELGMMLMSDYLLPFIVTGILLLVAIIGALLMATRVEHEPRQE